ncbi:hypothetical protein N7568_25760, partial [Paenarthrobacter aurescens]|nr:hypothetical protein [Paenarthrobacter aurescens]
FCMNIAHVGTSVITVESQPFFIIEISNMPHRFISLWLLVLSGSVAAQDPAISSSISYTRDIQPIFTEKCVACHACY